MTQHPPCSPTPSSKPEDLNQEISWKLKILDFAMLVLSHPSMMQAVKEMATKELGTAIKRMMSLIDPSMPGTSASSTDTHGLHTSTGTPTIVSQKVLPMSLMTSSQPPIAGSSQNTQQTSMSTTLLTGRAFTRPYRQTKKNWCDSQKRKQSRRGRRRRRRDNQRRNRNHPS